MLAKRYFAPAVLSLVLISSSSLADIKIGNTIPYSGPLAGFGTIAKAAGAYFKKANEEGQTAEKIDFVSLDDAFSPPKTVEQTRRLVEQDQVKILFLTFGTANNAAVRDYVNEQKVPQIFFYSGATFLKDPEKHPESVSFLPSYGIETQAYAHYILKSVPDAKIAVLYQNDAYGKDNFEGFKKGLGDKADKLIVAVQNYVTTDPTIDSQILKLKNSGANVLVDFSGGKFVPQVIKKVHSLGWTPLHFLTSVSTSIKSALEPAGLDASKGVISTAFYKSASDPRWANDPAMKEYLEFMKKYLPEANPKDDYAVQGVIAAQAMIHVLKQCGKDCSRENILKAATHLKNVSFPLLVPGLKMNTTPTDYDLFKQVQMIKFDGEKWVAFGDLVDLSKAK